MKRKNRTKKSSRPDFVSAFFGLILRIVKVILPAVVLAAVFFLSFQGVRHYLFADDFFKLVSVHTVTNGILLPEAISRIAGISLGDNVLAIDLEQVTKKLESDPRISEAVLTRILPNQVSIAIKERREFLRVKLSGKDEVLVMDEDGFLLGPADPGSRLPVFEDLRPQGMNLFIHDRYQDRQMLRMIFQIRAMIAREPIFQEKKIQFIKIDSSKRIQIGLQDGFEIRVSENFAEELKKLDALRPLLEKDMGTFEYLDLRFQDVVARKKQENKNKGRLRR